MEKKYDSFMDAFIDSILPAFLENIPLEDAYSLEKAFISRIKADYEDVITQVCNMPNGTPEMVISVFSKDLIKRWSDMDVETKKSLLVTDEKFQELKSMSNMAFKLALNSARENTIINNEKAYREFLTRISNLLDDIQEYNVEIAKEVLSETLLDLDYAYGKSKIKSLRLGSSV